MNTTRHELFFSPDVFGDRRVDIIGVGATGSLVAMDLAQYGVRNIHVWDHDIVEPHNIPNQQFFTEHHLGKFKVDALQDLVKRKCGTIITTHQQRVTEKVALGDVVFLLVDSMTSREEIWKQSIRLKSNIKLMVETRTDVTHGEVFALEPKRSSHCAFWEDNFTPDDEIQSATTACGGTQTIISTINIIAGVATSLFRQHINRLLGVETHEEENKTPPHYVLVSTNPYYMEHQHIALL